MLLPFNKSMENKAAGKRTIVLAGDIGATKTNLTFFQKEAGLVSFTA